MLFILKDLEVRIVWVGARAKMQVVVENVSSSTKCSAVGSKFLLGDATADKYVGFLSLWKPFSVVFPERNFDKSYDGCTHKTLTSGDPVIVRNDVISSTKM